MYKRLFFILIGLILSGMIFWSCSDDGGSTNPPPTPSLKIVSPNGGEIVQRGDVVIIHFENELTDSVAIQLYKNGEYLEDIESLVTTADSLEWLVPNALDVGTDYQIMITSIENEDKYDLSDGMFTVAPAGNYIIVTSPNGGGIWLKGTTKQITWYDNIPGGVNIFLLKNGVPVMDIFGTPQASSGTKSWTIPGTLTDGADYEIQIVSVDNAAVNDISDSFFCLATNDNTQNIVGDWDAVGTWSKWATVWNFNADGTFINGYNEPGTWYMTGNGIKVEFDLATHSFLAIVDGNHLEGTMSDIAGQGTWYADRVIPELLTPNGGEVFMRGTTQTITWDPGQYGNIVINLVDSTGVVAPIATVADSLGTYDWAIPSNVEPGAAYLIRIEKEINSLAFDESDHCFCISADETVDMIGEWQVNYYWSKSTMYLNFKIDNTWEIVGNTTYTGVWTLVGNGLLLDPDYSDFIYIGIVTGDKIQGTTQQPPNFTGVWDAHRILEVVTPNGGGFYNAGVVVPITWYETITAENVTIDLYENDVFNRNIGTVNVNTTPSYNWTVPANLTTSTKYKIRMTSTTSDIYDESDDYFTVVAVPATPAVEDETFDDGIAQNWGVVTGNWTLADSLYKSDNVTAPTSIYTSTTVLNTEITGNYQVEVKARKVSGNFYYGILLNGDSTNVDTQGMWNSIQFMVDVDGTGQYYLAYYSNGSWMSVSNATPPALNTGLNVWNTLKVIVNNDTNEYHLFINDQYIGTVVDTHYNHGLVGLYDYNTIQSETEFDYIRITPVNKSAMDGINIKILEPSEPVELGVK